MLDTATKKRIDDCRDILVGKLPDPKAQIEQITIGLIYKFMDDMDKEAIELGGKAKFFSSNYKKYSWDSLFDTKVTATEMLRLYSEAIAGMDKNPNIPQLFRDIFKNAYLPYRDPETLKLFLKTINEFKYTHSEKLGDAFEYLLSVMGSQGDAGQFRTPRHIIDFIVAAVDPGKNDNILEPACGTAGFLISAFKHIKEKNKKGLTPDERKKIIQNFVGYDISPDMVRLSLVNLYLHGFSDPHIWEYDTLTSEDRWNETYDVILANPPFMSPKGGIRPHKKFSISSNRSEVLFVDYIAEHLNPKGKAGIIVPEGIIFQSATAYKALRKMLIDKNYLYAVVSLPAGIFQPYSGVKTSILLMDKTLAKKTDNILFVKIENDGFDLGAQRKAHDKNDLAGCLELLQQYKQTLQDNASFESDNRNVFVVEKKTIAEKGDYNLSIDRYRKNGEIQQSEYEIVKLSDVCEINPKKSEIKELPDDILVSFVPMVDLNDDGMDFTPKEERKLSEVVGGYTYFKDNDVLVAKVTPCFENGKAGVAKNLKNGIGFGSSEYYVLRCSEKIIPEFVYLIVTSEKFRTEGKEQMTGTGGLQRVPKDFVANFQIPLPPIYQQQQLFNNVAYQKIIEGAKAVVENYKPKIDIDPDWGMVELGEVCDVRSGGTPSRNENSYWNGNIPWVGSTVCKDVLVDSAEEFITKEGLSKSSAKIFNSGTTLIALVGATIGKTGFLTFDCSTNQNIAGLYPKDISILSEKYLYYACQSLYPNFMSLGEGKFRMATLGFVKEQKISLPPIETQHQIVSQIEKEQALVNANKQLIEIFEQKIKDRIAKVWGADKNAPVLNAENDMLTMAAEE